WTQRGSKHISTRAIHMIRQVHTGSKQRPAYSLKKLKGMTKPLSACRLRALTRNWNNPAIVHWKGAMSMLTSEQPLMIRDVHAQDRPRERLVNQGATSLSNQELIAILLRTGTKQESVLHLSNQVLHHFEHLHHLKDATIEEMTSI